MTASQSERLDAARVKIEAATKQFLASGGEIVQLGNKLSPIKSQSWMEEARIAKAAGLSHVSEYGRSEPRKPASQAGSEVSPAQLSSMQRAVKASVNAKKRRRARLAPQVKALAAKKYPVTQIATQLGIAPGTVRRIGRDHGIQLNTSRGAMPAKEGTV